MIYFIPAWYANGHFREYEPFWYERQMKTEADDTVKQLQLFHGDSDYDSSILLLSYAPNLRHFLHRQGIFRVPYWSVFDAIQEVRQKKQALFSFQQLKWPENTEFVYTLFAVYAKQSQEKYEKLEFGADGNLTELHEYQNGQLVRKNIYDDRGFLSCSVFFDKGERLYDTYWTDQGVWKLRHFADDHVEINPLRNQYLIDVDGEANSVSFAKSMYPSMDTVVEEVLATFLQTTRKTDVFCAAVHETHIAMLGRQLAGRRSIFSMFENRFSIEKNRELLPVLARGGALVADTWENLKLLSKEKTLEHTFKVKIPPYAVQFTPGISQQLKVQKILFPTDHLSPELLEAGIKAMAQYLAENKTARVCLFTRDNGFNRKAELEAQVHRILEGNDFSGLAPLFTAKQCVDELAVNNCMREQRILLDLSDNPELLLQISAVSAGIPQIVKIATEYVHPGKNGRINRDTLRLGEDLDYYLANLSHWNEAALYSHEIGKAHTAQRLTGRWKKVVEQIENGASIAAGGN